MKELVHRSLLPMRSLLRYYRKGRLMLSQLLRYGELTQPRFYTFSDRKLIYLEVPKVMCTSIKTTIGWAYQIETQNELNIHNHEAWQYEWGRPQKQSSEYIIFTFVRNPYDRLVSCYRDKVIDVKQRYSIPYFVANSALYPYRIPSHITFEEFVKIVIKVPDRFADPHFKSQYAILSHHGYLLPDFIGSLENMEQDWGKLASKYNFHPQLAHQQSSKEPNDAKNDYRTYYTAELADLVYKRYKYDFELLGYATAQQELLETISNNGGGG